jgi:hypothetical protein
VEYSTKSKCYVRLDEIERYLENRQILIRGLIQSAQAYAFWCTIEASAVRSVDKCKLIDGQ